MPLKVVVAQGAADSVVRCRVLASYPTDWISGFEMSGYTKKYRSEFDELDNAFVFHSRTVFLWSKKK